MKNNTTTSLKSQSKTAKRSLPHSICYLFIGFCCYLRTLRTPHANYILCTKLVSAFGPKRAASNIKWPKTQRNRVRNGYSGNLVCHASLNLLTQHASGKVDICIGTAKWTKWTFWKRISLATLSKIDHVDYTVMGFFPLFEYAFILFFLFI